MARRRRDMGALAGVLAGTLCLLTACQDEPDFDERYQSAEKNIRSKAAELDAELNKATRTPSGEDSQGVAASPTGTAGERPAT
jgi:hypothetical protein